MFRFAHSSEVGARVPAEQKVEVGGDLLELRGGETLAAEERSKQGGDGVGGHAARILVGGRGCQRRRCRRSKTEVPRLRRQKRPPQGGMTGGETGLAPRARMLRSGRPAGTRPNTPARRSRHTDSLALEIAQKAECCATGGRRRRRPSTWMRSAPESRNRFLFQLLKSRMYAPASKRVTGGIRCPEMQVPGPKRLRDDSS